jgi:hypothetical protein
VAEETYHIIMRKTTSDHQVSIIYNRNASYII